MKAEESTTVLTTTDDKTKAKTRFKLLSWNIDGLDEQENTIEIRTRGVINVIKRYRIFSIQYSFYSFEIYREEPDAVFLQEVVPIAFDLIQNLLPEYNSYAG
jgi:hypothetical protein